MFRVVFVMREIEDLSIEETAGFLKPASGNGEDQIAPGPAPVAPSPRRTTRPRLGGCIPVRRHALHRNGRQGLGAARTFITVYRLTWPHGGWATDFALIKPGDSLGGQEDPMKRRTKIAVGTIIGGAGLSAVAIALAAAPTHKSVDAENARHAAGDA